MATPLASGYIDLTVKYGSAMKQISADFDGLESTAGKAGTKAGKALSGGLEKGVDGKRIGKNLERDITGSASGRAVGMFIGRSIGEGVNATLPGSLRNALQEFGSIAERDGRAAAAGTLLGRSMGNAVKGAFLAGTAGLTAGIGYTLFKGFERLEKIDQARAKLQALGNTAGDVDAIMKSATEAVTDTAFSLSDAADAAAAAVAAGLKPGQQLTDYLTEIADLAAVSQRPLDDVAGIFNKIQTTNKVYLEDLQQLPDIPIFKWLQDEYGVTADALSEMVSKGEVDAAHFQAVIDKNIGGAAKKMGESFSGAVENAQTAVARVGANFLAQIFGGDQVNALDGPTKAINSLTEQLDKANGWVTAHGPEIKQFFTDAAETAKDLAGAVGDIITFLDTMGISVGDVVLAFAAFKTGELVVGAVDALRGMGKDLDDLPGKASKSARGINAAFALIVVPEIGKMLSDQIDTYLAENFPELNDLNHSYTPDQLGQRARQWVDENIFGSGLPQTGSPNVAAPQGSLYPGIPPAQMNAPAGTRDSGGVTPNSTGLPSDQARRPAGTRESGGVPGAASPGVALKNYSTPMGIAPPLQGNFGAEGWRPTVRSVIAMYGPQLGITNSKAWEDALIRQIQTESGGNPKADNPTDGNGRGGQQHVSGLLQFLPSTFNAHNISGGAYLDPIAQIAAALDYVNSRYGVDGSGAPLHIGRGVGYATGGGVPGVGRGDIVPAMLEPGEHVFDRGDVAAMGGQAGVYAFRRRLHGYDATGGEVTGLTPEEILALATVDPNTTQHGAGQGATPGPTPDQLAGPPGPAPMRTEGYIPAAAGSSGTAGTSFASGLYEMGADAINGLIDQAASAASSAASMGANVFAPGSGGAAGAAAGAAIGIGTQAAKRGVKFGAQLAGIWTDAIPEILLPFGVPRFFNTDVTGFMPQLSMSPIGVTTGEKAQLQQQGGPMDPAQMPGGPVQPGQLPGQQPVGSPAQPAQPGGVMPGPPPAPMDPGAAMGEALTPPGLRQNPGQPPPSDPLDFLSKILPGGAGIFDSGGVMPPRSIGINASRKPELVLNNAQHQQWSDTMQAVANSPVAEFDPTSSGVQFHDTWHVTVKDLDEMERKANDRKRRQMKRYGGRPTMGGA